MPLNVMSSPRSIASVVVPDVRFENVSVPLIVDFASMATVSELGLDCGLLAASRSLNIRVKVRPFTVTVGQTKNPVDAVKTQLSGKKVGDEEKTRPTSGEATLTADPRLEIDISRSSEATSGTLGVAGAVDESEQAATMNDVAS